MCKKLLKTLRHKLMGDGVYKVGVACMLPADISDSIRLLELKIASQTANEQGLSQPPNITVKRPFEVDSLQILSEFCRQLRHLASNIQSPAISYCGIDTFPGGSVFMAVEQTDELIILHDKVLGLCADFGAIPDEFEGKNMVFHTSLALSLNTDQQSAAAAIAHTAQYIRSRVVSSSLAVLLWTDVGGWIVIANAPFSMY